MKKFRFLSSMLAVIMVLSMLTVVIPVSAAEMAGNTFFCDFESFDTGNVTTAGCNASGFDWVLNPQYGVIETDSVYGKGVGVTNQFALGINMDTLVTTGKVRIGFSFKGGSWGYIYLNSKITSSWDDGKGYRKQILNYGANGIALLKEDGTGAGSKTTSNGTWYYVECIVDVDTDTCSLYVNGSKIKDYLWEDGIDTVGGFSFYNGGSRTSWGLVDNIAVSVETGNLQIITADIDADNKIKVAFSEALGDNITESDVMINECGSNTYIDVSDIGIQDNKMMITYDDELEAGKEYCVSFGENVKSKSGKSVSDCAYVYQPEGSTVTPYTQLKNFEDVETKKSTYTANNAEHEYDAVTSEYAINIIRNGGYYAGTVGAEPRTIITAVDSTKTGDTKASGNALGVNVYTNCRLLDIIPTDIGVETYEFDFTYNALGGNKLTLIHTTGTSSANNPTEVSTAIGSTTTWKHMRIDYDTVADTIFVYIDGALNKKTEGISSFEHPLSFTHVKTGESLIGIDNYQSYTTVTPLNVEKVRYTDASGKVTGANTISPETTSIDITFSENVDAAVADAITLTADGTDIYFGEPVIDGKVVTLNVPGMLPGGSDIQLAIPAADRVYNVVTTAGKFEVTDIDIKVNGAEVAVPGNTGAAGANVSVTGYVINTEAQPQTLTVIYAFYNDDELVDVWSKDIVLESTDYAYEIAETDTTKANIDYDAVKAFVWDGLTTATPLTVAVSYSAN